ncbi:MAG: TM2 domain-containing protein [Huintestinicola sp.]
MNEFYSDKRDEKGERVATDQSGKAMSGDRDRDKNYGASGGASAYSTASSNGAQQAQRYGGTETAYADDSRSEIKLVVNDGNPPANAASSNYCSSCGAPLKTDQVYCTKCGAKRSEDASGSTPQYSSMYKGTGAGTYQNNYAPNTYSGGYSPNVGGITGNKKNKWVAFFLCMFLGAIGAHKFYEGKVGLGILYLFTGGLFTIGWIIDLIVLLLKPPYYDP